MNACTHESTTPTRLTVAAGIVWNNERFLVAQKNKGRFKGFWEFPGGKCEDGEPPLKALCRELNEELAIVVKKALFWHVIDHTYSEHNLCVSLHFFHVLSYEGHPQGNEGQPIRWVTPSEAQALPFLAADAPILTQLAEQKKGSPNGLPPLSLRR